MAQLWGGRFEKQEDALVNAFNASIQFDKRLLHEDIEEAWLMRRCWENRAF